ncbi:signal peptide peptidase SppA [Parvularcula dongshanensis]|uniref:Protease-4 n=1 Tax=Parvularcula dongshanensis TaxID=1173995 RepID=A0A840I0J8_9PROT|nr:protease-4 [Parvularcula dongshanensis]
MTQVAERERMTVWSFLKNAAKVVIGLSLLVQSLLFILLLVVVFGLIGGVSQQMSGEKQAAMRIEDGVALVLNPDGVLSEQAPPSDPFQDALSQAFGGGGPGEVSVHDLIRVVRAAKEDSRIDALVLDLGKLYVPTIYASKAYDLADAIAEFRDSGKRVIAVADNYTQEQYLLASEADTVLMHDYGQVFVLGYGSYRTYYKSALDKLKVNSHVFRVGTFKSALEPYLRDDMSEPAKLANQAFLDVLWQRYTSTVEANRGLSSGTVNAFGQDMPRYLEAANGDMAQMAKDVGLVDEVMGRADQVAYLANIVGEDEELGFRQVDFQKYRAAMSDPADRPRVGNVAVVTASGAIVDGDERPGVAAGDAIAQQLREAREDENVKAVVLRVDSPGGSAFASEVMRDEVIALKEAGKPVVVSMGSLAASGGYWISAAADEIWASPTTITGSIGIFGYIPTLENTLADIGVNTDGVGTTPLSGFTAAGLGPLPDQAGQILQMSIEEGYDRFLTVVSEGRGLSKKAVDDVGQGRVWIGETAEGLGLVDKLGDLDDAISAAAERAELEDWDVVGMSREKSAFELFVEGLTGVGIKLGLVEAPKTELFGSRASHRGTMAQLTDAIRAEAEFQASFNDPNAIYARCVVCEAR